MLRCLFDLMSGPVFVPLSYLVPDSEGRCVYAEEIGVSFVEDDTGDIGTRKIN